ncbi:ABC transporter permease [Larkinella soli]|uniref:ABC transporter permease n=1 Tax=Larkinella soli TaxID=1770527 RepID=UPI001E301DF6|nr:ABC transporter permease [Larkinella soli]
MKNPNAAPPRWVRRLLAWFHPAETLEEVEGDLEELYSFWYNRDGETRATLYYLRSVLSVLPPFVRRRPERSESRPPFPFATDMLRNYLKIAFRNLLKQPVFSLINITGLSLGLATVLFILLFVQDEVSFDRFQERGDRLYRLVYHYTSADRPDGRSSLSGYPQGPAFTREVPEVEAFCRMHGWEMLVRKGTEGIYQRVMYVDSTFFRLFSFGLLAGDPATALRDPGSVVLTDETARKYFGTVDVVGKTLSIDAGGRFEPNRITAVVKAPPMNSSLRFDALRPFVAALPPDRKAWGEDQWFNFFTNTFLLLRPDADPARAEQNMERVFRKYGGKQYADLRKQEQDYRIQYRLQPFLQMHLQAGYGMNNGLATGSNALYSYILGGIAGLILLIACINFINLTLARSLRRGKEIGVRKVTGSTRGQLVMQFLGESLILTGLAFLPALLLVVSLLPVFSDLANKSLEIGFLLAPQTIGLFLGLLLLVGLLAGSYPALVLSGFSPIQTLYGRFRFNGGNWLGKSLVVLQFAIAVFLLIGTVVLHGQFHFIRTADVGYETANRVRVYIPWGREQKGELLQAALRGRPGIRIATRKQGGYYGDAFLVNGRPTRQVAVERMDDQYLRFLNVPVVQGRELSYANPADTVSNILVNQTFVRMYLDAKKPAVGQVVQKEGENGRRETFTIAGVVRDYQVGSLRSELEPMLLWLGKPHQMNQLYVKLDPAYTPAALRRIETTYKALIPFQPFSYEFTEDDRMEAYADDARWKSLISAAAAIAILISALGLFGLVSLSVEQRTKEIGIRKVLGAGLPEIVGQLSGNFLKLVLLAIGIGMPVGWYVGRRWLDGFVYRIEFGWWIFAFVGLLTVGIALLTVSVQAVRAALTNPARTLRSD